MLSRRRIIVVESKNGCKIRLTRERWRHIVKNHGYMEGEREKIIETLNSPDYIVRGHGTELLAIRHYSKTSISEKYCVTVYKEENEESFVITAFMTSKGDKLIERGAVWRK